ncbi:MAG: chromate transporter [Eubacterium sp.]|nr:chromate transporter [Eubacterium sp.]
MRELWTLFITFARIGGFTFGGGYAMLPMLQKEVVENRHWATEEELMDYYAVGQCTPGIIAVNTATFVGYKKKGIIGGIAATLGVVAPSLVIIMIITAFIKNFAQLEMVQHALAGVRVCVVVLVFDAVFKLAKKSLVDAAAFLIFFLVMALSFFTDVPTYMLVIAAGLAGIIIKVVLEKKKANEEVGS